MSIGNKTFTLAPWSICWTVENGQRTGGHIVGSDGKGSTAPICDVPFFPRRRDPGETQANLHLIASAPDLLAALKAISLNAENVNLSHEDFRIQARLAADAVIVVLPGKSGERSS